MKRPKTLQDGVRYFADEQVCIEIVAELRWPNGPVCPKCGHTEHYYLATQKRWKCKRCSKQFSVKAGTIFEDSPIPLDKWLTALWMLVNCKNGISSYEVARDLGITQKSAWFVLHRLRLAMQNQDLGKKLGRRGREIEADETFIGGAARFMHPERRKRMITERGFKDKLAVMRILERGGEVRAIVLPNRRKHQVQGEIRRHVNAHGAIYSDALLSYQGLNHQGFVHQVIDQA